VLRRAKVLSAAQYAEAVTSRPAPSTERSLFEMKTSSEEGAQRRLLQQRDYEHN
jgi:hypothetical protein